MLVSLTVAALVGWTLAGVYAYVAVRLRERTAEDPSLRRALAFFALWWAATAANIALGSALNLAASFGFTDFPLQLTYTYLQRILLSVSLVGLMYYLVFLFTGRDALGPLVAIYAAYYLFQVYSIVAGGPVGVKVGRWRTDLLYAAPVEPALLLLNFVWLVVPPVVGSFLLFRLHFLVDSPTQKWRTLLVPWAIVLWWVVAVVAGHRDAFDHDGLQVANRLVNIGAAVVILFAYFPPAWARARFGVEPLAPAPNGRSAA